MDSEPALPPRLGTLVRETQEVERFRPTRGTSFSTFDRIAAELDQTRLSFMQFQAKLGEPRVEFFQAHAVASLWFSKPITKSSADQRCASVPGTY